MTPDLLPAAPASRQPANDDVGNAPGVSVAGLRCAHCGQPAVVDIAVFDPVGGWLSAYHVPECAAAAGVWPWDGVART